MKWNWKKLAGMALGLGIAGLMLFANLLGMDDNTAWGIKRFAVFFLGILLFIVCLLYREDNFIGRIFNTRTGRVHLAVGIMGGGVLLSYVWWVSLGLWTTFPASTDYYDLLASAFSHGQLALEIQPDPALLALENPYAPENRAGIPVLWDATLYKGKYYLYWGPAPALLIALIKIFYPGVIGDQFLVLCFMAGLFIFETLIILEVWENFLQQIPGWTIPFMVMLAGCINPLLWVLPDPRIYEAAVASGQFFFIGGIYWLITAFNRLTPSKVRLMLSGLFFALAVGSRTILVLPIAFLSLMVLAWSFQNHRKNLISLLAAFAIPLALGALGYGWYNHARFGSVTEFGYGYQLTGFNIHEAIDETFSLAYVPLNLFKTLLNPYELRDTFPFIRPTLWSGPAWFENYHPKIYYYFAESITGILVASPFVLFAGLSFLGWKNSEAFLKWMITSLAGSTLLVFFTTQAFFYTTMRYLLDLIPALTLLAIIGFWMGLHLPNARQKALYISISAGLWAYTMIVGILLAFGSNLQRFKTFNPEIIQQLTWTITNLIK